MFVKFLQNLKNIMEEFKETVDWKGCSFPKHTLHTISSFREFFKKLWNSFLSKGTQAIVEAASQGVFLESCMSNYTVNLQQPRHHIDVAKNAEQTS